MVCSGKKTAGAFQGGRGRGHERGALYQKFLFRWQRGSVSVFD